MANPELACPAALVLRAKALVILYAGFCSGFDPVFALVLALGSLLVLARF